ncbi:MAG: MFS transporter, partial [Methanobacterium sp.]|nr:MFS transporter [Methanobacterium sp.]
SASLSTLIYIGQTLSLGVLLFILTGYMGDVQIVPGNYHLFIEGLHVSFLLFAVISAMVIGVTIYVERRIS